jgi:Na+-translocating ferredoxin:NAD+ oxidoreductase RnfD subunit
MHSCVKQSGNYKYEKKAYSLYVVLTFLLLEMATITSMSYLFRSIGGVVGISLTSAIFQGVVKNILQDKITGPNAELYIEIARKSMTEVRELLPPDVLAIVLDVYQTGLRYTFLSCAGISCLTVISALFIESNDLSARVPTIKK